MERDGPGRRVGGIEVENLRINEIWACCTDFIVKSMPAL